MTAGLNAIHKAERSHQTNRAVPAHSQITYVVEKDDSRRASRINRFAQQSADDDIGTARFVDGRRTITVELVAENRQPFGHRTIAKFRPSADDKPRRFSAGVRINYVNSFQIAVCHRFTTLIEFECEKKVDGLYTSRRKVLSKISIWFSKGGTTVICVG